MESNPRCALRRGSKSVACKPYQEGLASVWRHYPSECVAHVVLQSGTASKHQCRCNPDSLIQVTFLTQTDLSWLKNEFVTFYDGNPLSANPFSKLLTIVPARPAEARGWIFLCPEGPAQHLNASRQQLTPHCLAAILDSQLPSPKLSPKCLPNCLSPTREVFFPLSKLPPRRGQLCRDRVAKIVSRQFLPRGIEMPLRALWVFGKESRGKFVGSFRTQSYVGCCQRTTARTLKTVTSLN